jgi:ABC-type multidrug transport system ATPase subunit
MGVENQNSYENRGVGNASTATATVLEASDLGKRYGRRWLFRNLTFAVVPGQPMALSGQNGAGKSTLLQLLWGLKTPTEGSTALLVNGVALHRDERPMHVAYAAPYFELPTHLTGIEIATHFAAARPPYTSIASAKAQARLLAFGLSEAAFYMPVSEYSSGMRQRLRLAIAFADPAPLLLLDEPTTHLDAAGIRLYATALASAINNRMVVVASNIEAETEQIDRRLILS